MQTYMVNLRVFPYNALFGVCSLARLGFWPFFFVSDHPFLGKMLNLKGNICVRKRYGVFFPMAFSSFTGMVNFFFKDSQYIYIVYFELCLTMITSEKSERQISPTKQTP